jgi:interferon gamma-inducible protein 30
MLKKALFAGLILATVVLLSTYGQDEIAGYLNNHTADGKVKVDLYSESLCPDCLAFIRHSLKTAANTKDFWKICEFNIIPYGNAKRTQNGSNWAFTCQHGVRECQGNLIEGCAIKKYEFYTQALPFILCLEDNTTDFSAQGQRCATKFNLDWNAINTCATGTEGNKYMYDFAVATEKLVPAHTYVPWIVVNDRHTTSSENAVISNMVRYVCSIYTGPEHIAACN